MELPIDLLHWTLAVLPIAALAFFMIQLRWTAQQAGAMGVIVVAVIALAFFRTPAETLGVAGAKGVWDAIFILLVIWPALLLYQFMVRSGGYEAMRRGITAMSRNELFIVVALGWVFTSFLQSVDGFGTPIAIVAPLLVAFGLKPVYAVAIPIIAHVWAKFFGTLGVGWLATLQVVDLDPGTAMATAVESSVMLTLTALMGGLTVVWMYGRWAAVRHGWPLVLILAGIQGLGQFPALLVDPVLAAFLPATAALLALWPLSRWKRFAEPAPGIVDRPAMASEALASSAAGTGPQPPMSTAMAFFPYILLSVIAVLTSVITPLADLLGRFTVGFPFPAVGTGYGVETEAESAFSALAPLSHPGAGLLLTGLVTWLVFSARGYFRSWQVQKETQDPGALRGLLASAIPASVPIVTFLVMASMMNHSGQTATMALGISAVAPAAVYAFLANGIGVVGAFATSSQTSSNVLFSALQVNMAELKGLPVSTVLAAQSAGASIGNAVGPANVVMGASTAGIIGREGDILRKTLPWTLAAAAVTGIVTVVMVYV
ncbi:L-lactate permease [Brevibacterium salitolerans]|uniref:L-lactate permease n=1 Tax=Brevibacterium salitolerans TaxID=1403566 RepID=A0ABN2X440_9MICO